MPKQRTSKIHILIPLIAIGAIAAMQIFALSRGIDGVLLTASIAVIAGIGGYKLHGKPH